MTRTTTALLALLFALTITAPAAADDEVEVGSCLRLLAQEKLAEGVRNVSSDIETLEQGAEKVYSFTLFAGNSYSFKTCAAAKVTDLDIHLYDQGGKRVETRNEVDRQPVIEIKPEATGTYYLVLRVATTEDGTAGAAGYVQLYE